MLRLELHRQVACCAVQVHREVQPGSCVWCDSVSRWRLAGSGAWARKGTDVALSYNLRYAAPEVALCRRCTPLCVPCTQSHFFSNCWPDTRYHAPVNGG